MVDDFPVSRFVRAQGRSKVYTEEQLLERFAIFQRQITTWSVMTVKEHSFWRDFFGNNEDFEFENGVRAMAVVVENSLKDCFPEFNKHEKRR